MNIGEAAIPQQVQQQVAPDVTNQQGQSQLFQKAVEANKNKNLLDGILKSIAEKAGGSFDSRVKNIETAAQKITQKRLQGRLEYNTKNINDMVGFRLTLPSEKKFPEIEQAIKSLSKTGLFDIKKQELVKQGTYKGFHIDIKMQNGEGGEIQLHTPQTALEAIANHTLRGQYGENPNNDAVAILRDKQAQIAKKMPNNQALAVTKAIESIRKQNNNQPLDPRITAQVLSQAQ